jgi:hypothetical protein
MHESTFGMKKEDRASLSVSRGTRDKVQAYVEKRQAKERYRVTQDIVIEDAIDCLERHGTNAGGNGRKK